MKKQYIKLTRTEGPGQGTWAIYIKRSDGVYAYFMSSINSHDLLWPLHWNRRHIYNDIEYKYVDEKDIRSLKFIDCL